jgi:hypothetical protein
MTFLELCNRARQESGISGDGPLTTLNQIGILAKVVQWVRQANIDIQLMHGHWSFMWRMSTANLIPGQRDYSAVELGIADCNLIRSMDIGGNTITLMDWDLFKQHGYLHETGSQQPTVYAVRPDGRFVFYPVPDQGYTLTAEYMINPIELLNDSDVSVIPEKHHDAILHKALMYYATHEEDWNLHQASERRFNDRIAQLSAAYLPRIKLAAGIR